MAGKGKQKIEEWKAIMKEAHVYISFITKEYMLWLSIDSKFK